MRKHCINKNYNTESLNTRKFEDKKVYVLETASVLSIFVSKEELLGTRYHASKGVSVDFMKNHLAFLHCCLCNENKHIFT